MYIKLKNIVGWCQGRAWSINGYFIQLHQNQRKRGDDNTMEFKGRKQEIQTKSIKLNLSEREYNKLKALAEQQGLNMSAYIRRECIYKPYKNLLEAKRNVDYDL